jgi:hypothetical protein
MNARELEPASPAAARDFYYGTVRPLGVGTRLRAEPTADAELDALLDAARSPTADRRSCAVAAASSIKDATVIAAIRFDRSTAAEASCSRIRVFRVHLEAFHTAPFAVLEELSGRLRTGGSLEALVREYWEPTGLWHIREVLAPSLLVIEEVPPASGRETYVPRWVLYRKDGERARGL